MTAERTDYCFDLSKYITNAVCHEIACPYANGCEILQNSNGG